jgi:arsenate reductase
MDRIYHLSTCSTCKKILAGLFPKGIPDAFRVSDVKTHPISPEELDEVAGIAGSYQGLLNKQSRKYKAMDLKDTVMSEQQIRTLILSDYTLLKRPLVVYNGNVYAGNAPSTVDALARSLA